MLLKKTHCSDLKLLEKGPQKSTFLFFFFSFRGVVHVLAFDHLLCNYQFCSSSTSTSTSAYEFACHFISGEKKKAN